MAQEAELASSIGVHIPLRQGGYGKLNKIEFRADELRTGNLKRRKIVSKADTAAAVFQRFVTPATKNAQGKKFHGKVKRRRPICEIQSPLGLFCMQYK